MGMNVETKFDMCSTNKSFIPCELVFLSQSSVKRNNRDVTKERRGYKTERNVLLRPTIGRSRVTGSRAPGSAWVCRIDRERTAVRLFRLLRQEWVRLDGPALASVYYPNCYFQMFCGGLTQSG